MTIFPVYCGAAGVATLDDARAVMAAAPAASAAGCELAAGVLFRDETLDGRESTKSRYPSLEAASRIAATLAGEVLVVAHVHTAERGDAMERKLRRLHGLMPGCAAQINMPELSPEEFGRARACFEGVGVIAQVSRGRYTDGGWVSHARGLARHGADVILLDSSRGEGVLFDVAEIADAVRAYDGARVGVPLAVAGGLGPDAVGVLLRLRASLGHARMALVSADAESGLRSGGDPRTSTLDPVRLLGWVDAFAASRVRPTEAAAVAAR